MEVERLARGDGIDPGALSQAFKCSGTKIITPAKTYDPANEFDEEYFRVRTVHVPPRYKTIQAPHGGRTHCLGQEGKYMGKTDPYGYFRVKVPNGKGYTLKLKPAAGRHRPRGLQPASGRAWAAI